MHQAPTPLNDARTYCPTTTRVKLGQGAILVDVREPEEVAQLAFDTPGVIALPLSELEQRWRELPTTHELIFACAVGQRSLKATYFLMYQGNTNVANMEGGITKWARKGFPVHGTPPAIATDSGCCGGGSCAPDPTNPTSCG